MVQGVPADAVLPSLRRDLRVIGRSQDPRGEAVWVIFDPLRNRYLELRPLAFEILSRWRLGKAQVITEAISKETPYRVTTAEILHFIKFLSENQLLNQRRSPANSRQLSGWDRIQKLLSVLVFFRLRLLRSDKVLGVLADNLGFLFRPWFWSAIGILGISGILMIARRWDSFIQTFSDFVNLQGLLVLVAAVVFSKVVHELGHALSAKHLGARVPAMGIAFILGAPLAYTDVSDTWRLLRRRDRVLVSSGGMLAETALAAIATWGWLILPDGPMRSAFFVIATTSWLATLAINLNPFLRFDGYYILSDLTGLRNLQSRSFAMGRWALRCLLFGWTAPAPETVESRLSSFLIGFAWLTWCVRAVVYLGLAVIAYLMFGKVLGSIVAVLEIWLLVASPVLKEFRSVIKARKVWLGQPRAWITMAMIVLLFLFALYPQSYRMALPAVMTPSERLWVHAPTPAMVTEHPLKAGPVKAKTTVLKLEDPDLDHQIEQTRRRLSITELLLRQTGGSQVAARQQGILAEERAQQASALEGLLAQRRRLFVSAPFNGQVTDIDPELRQGIWVDQETPLFLIIGDGPPQLRAFVDDRDRSLLPKGGAAEFYPEASEYPIMKGVIKDLQSVPLGYLEEPLLASVNGGEVPTRKDEQGRLVPEHGLYQVTIELKGDIAMTDNIPMILRGRVYCDSKPYALVNLALNRLRAIFVEEFGI